MRTSSPRPALSMKSIVSVVEEITDGIAEQSSTLGERDFANNVRDHRPARLSRNHRTLRGRAFFHAEAKPIQNFTASGSDLGGVRSNNDERVTFVQDMTEKGEVFGGAFARFCFPTPVASLSERVR